MICVGIHIIMELYLPSRYDGVTHEWMKWYLNRVICTDHIGHDKIMNVKVGLCDPDPDWMSKNKSFALHSELQSIPNNFSFIQLTL